MESNKEQAVLMSFKMPYNSLLSPPRLISLIKFCESEFTWILFQFIWAAILNASVIAIASAMSGELTNWTEEDPCQNWDESRSRKCHPTPDCFDSWCHAASTKQSLSLLLSGWLAGCLWVTLLSFICADSHSRVSFMALIVVSPGDITLRSNNSLLRVIQIDQIIQG